MATAVLSSSSAQQQQQQQLWHQHQYQHHHIGTPSRRFVYVRGSLATIAEGQRYCRQEAGLKGAAPGRWLLQIPAAISSACLVM
eukprot:1495363-Pleurochrysis_carterae.AAC.1